GKRSHQGCWSVLPVPGGWLSVGDDDVKKWSLSADEPVAVGQFKKRQKWGRRRAILLKRDLFCTSTSQEPLEVWSTDTLQRKTITEYAPLGWHWLVAGGDGSTVMIESTTGIVIVSAETGEVLATAPPLGIGEVGAVGDRLIDNCI